MQLGESRQIAAAPRTDWAGWPTCRELRDLVPPPSCWESRNTDGCIDSFLSPGYTRVNRNGQLGDAAALKASFKQMAQSGTSGGWKFHDAGIAIYGSAALVTQSVSMPLRNAEDETPVEHHQTMLWVRTEHGWKLVREHISYRVAPAKPR